MTDAASALDQVALAHATLRTYRVLDTPRDPAYDDLVAVVARFARADRAAIAFFDGDRTWCKAVAGELPTEWGRTGPDVAVAGTAPVRSIDGTTIGALLVFGDAPLDDGSAAALPVFAALVTQLLEERRATAPQDVEPWWVVVVDGTASMRAVSPAAAALIGRDPASLTGTHVFDLVHPDDHLLAVDSLSHTLAYPGEKYPLDLRFLRPDGSGVPFEVLAVGREVAAGDDIVFVVKPAAQRAESDAYVSEQARVLMKIARGDALEDTLGQLADFLHRFLGDGVALFVLEGAELRSAASAGLRPELVALLDHQQVAERSTTCGVVAFRAHALRCDDVAADPSWVAHGIAAELVDERAASCWATPMLSSDMTRAVGVIALFSGRGRSLRPHEVRLTDLCAAIASVAVLRTQAEMTLTRLAMHDALTGLPNRTLFIDRLGHALSQRRTPDRHTAVMFLDLDRFKVINDALGHEAGDELLIAVARRLQSVSRPSSTIARFGGDEFTVLCEDLSSPRDAAAVAQRLAAAFDTPLPLPTGEVMMSVSIGVAVADASASPSGMLRDADAAMYRAKDRGRNRVEFFDDDMRTQAVARLELEHALQEAVMRDEFLLVYQPEVDLRTGAVAGAEALLRWHHPGRGWISPSEFIPIAEETGAIREVGAWVMRAASEQAVRYTAVAGAHPFVTWANLSVVQLLQPGFVGAVERIIRTVQVPRGSFGLEITESALLTDQHAAIAVMTELRELGIQLAIDDFGTGYSSLAYLTKLPIDVVKVDRSFVETIVDDRRGRAIVHGVVRLAHAVGCRIVAEGVETEAQLSVLREIGCDLGQGYLFARPAPVGAPFGPPTV